MQYTHLGHWILPGSNFPFPLSWLSGTGGLRSQLLAQKLRDAETGGEGRGKVWKPDTDATRVVSKWVICTCPQAGLGHQEAN